MEALIMQRHNVNEFEKLDRAVLLNHESEFKVPRIAFVTSENRAEFVLKHGDWYVFVVDKSGCSVAMVNLMGNMDDADITVIINQSLHIHMNLDEFVTFINDCKDAGEVILRDIRDFQKDDTSILGKVLI